MSIKIYLTSNDMDSKKIRYVKNWGRVRQHFCSFVYATGKNRMIQARRDTTNLSRLKNIDLIFLSFPSFPPDFRCWFIKGLIITIYVNDVISAMCREWHQRWFYLPDARRDVIESEGARGTYCGIAYVVLFIDWRTIFRSSRYLMV